MLGGKIQIRICEFFKEVEELCKRRMTEKNEKKVEEEYE